MVPFDGLDMVGAGSCGLSLNITVVGIFGTTIMVVGIFGTIAVLFQVVLIIRNIFSCPLLFSEIIYRYKKHLYVWGFYIYYDICSVVMSDSVVNCGCKGYW